MLYLRLGAETVMNHVCRADIAARRVDLDAFEHVPRSSLRSWHSDTNWPFSSATSEGVSGFEYGTASSG
jgi:hypothetical protein